MRLFVALDIDDSIRERIVRFTEGVRAFAPEARWARPESLHVTLKFIGERAEDNLPRIKAALESIQGKAFQLAFRGYGFFPSERAARVFWIGIDASQNLISLAEIVNVRLDTLEIPKEEHTYSPHLTLARASGQSGSPGRQKSDRPHQRFQCLQEKLKELATPEFGAMTAREFFLYLSQSSPNGSKYTKLAAFALK
jgi:2'-5' RNA ligase